MNVNLDPIHEIPSLILIFFNLFYISIICTNLIPIFIKKLFNFEIKIGTIDKQKENDDDDFEILHEKLEDE